MNREEFVESSGGGLPDLGGTIGADTIEQDPKASRRLGMIGTRVVAKTVGMGEQQRRHRAAL
jgi:hypothetical protein